MKPKLRELISTLNSILKNNTALVKNDEEKFGKLVEEIKNSYKNEEKISKEVLVELQEFRSVIEKLESKIAKSKLEAPFDGFITDLRTKAGKKTKPNFSASIWSHSGRSSRMP